MRRALLVFIALVAAWLVACAVLFVWPSAETGAPKHANAVVVLSGDPDRLPTALALIRRGVAPVLAISSVALTPKWAEGERLCHAGRYDGASVLCFTARPYSTRGEAETFTRIVRAHHWTSIVIVSSTYHLTRAKMLFRRCYAGKLALVGAPSRWELLPEDWAAETVKLAVQSVWETSC